MFNLLKILTMTTFNIETSKSSTLYKVLHTCSVLYENFDFSRRDSKHFALRFVGDNFAYKFHMADCHTGTVFYYRNEHGIVLNVKYDNKSLYLSSISL